MTQKIYVYIPGLEYISKGPLHIDAIHLKVTVNLVKNDSTDESNIPVYLFKGDDVSGDIKGNIVYKQITPYESITTGIVQKYPTSGPSATQAKYRAKKGRYYDFVKLENNTTKHLITPQPQKADGATCSNLNLYEHDGLFVVELDKLNTDLVLNFTFYSRIDNSESTEDVITFGAIDSECNLNTIDLNKYVEVGKWVLTYNPAISGVKEEEFKRADFKQQYFDLKGWGINEKEWEIPVNADILVTRLGESDIQVDNKYISAQYTYITNPRNPDFSPNPDFRHHVWNKSLSCNTIAYGSYSAYYRNFYLRTAKSSDFQADDERIDYSVSDKNISSDKPFNLVGVGVYDRDKEDWTGVYFIEYWLKKYKENSIKKSFYITYTNLENLGYLYRDFPEVNINNISNLAKYSHTDKNSRPIAACKIESYNLKDLDEVYKPGTSEFKPMSAVLSDLRSVRKQFGVWKKQTVTGSRGTFKDLPSSFKANLSVELPNGSNTVTSDSTITMSHYDLGCRELWPSDKQDVSHNRYLDLLLFESNSYRGYPGTGGIYSKNNYNFHLAYYFNTLNSNGSGANPSNNSFFWFNGGNQTIKLEGSSLIKQTKTIKEASIPVWQIFSFYLDTNNKWESPENVTKEYERIKKVWNTGERTTSDLLTDIKEGWEAHSDINRSDYQDKHPVYLFIPEMWYIDLNKSNITYNNKADFKVCPMVYTDSTGYLTENGSAVVADVNVTTDNLLDDSSIQEEFEILRVLNTDDVFKAPYELKKHTKSGSHISTTNTYFDTSYCNEKRFIQTEGEYTFKKTSVKLEGNSLYVLKVQTLFPFKSENGNSGIEVKLAVNKNGGPSAYYRVLSSDGQLLIHNLGNGEAILNIDSLKIKSYYFNKTEVASDNYGYQTTTTTYNILSGVGLYKVDLSNTSTNTMVLKLALDNSDFKTFGVITPNLSNIDLFYNRIIFPAAHCAEEDVVFCDLVKRLANTYKPNYRNTYYDATTNSDPIVHTYNFKYLPDKAIYRVSGFYTLPTSGNEYKVSGKYTPFSDKYNFGEEENPVIGITVKQIQS